MKKLLTTFFFGGLISSLIAQGTWIQKTSFGGMTRVESVALNIGNKGYVGTGMNLGTRLNDFWEYDQLMDSWTQKADFAGVARSGACGFSIGNVCYLGTGFDNVNTPRKDFWKYDPGTNTWMQKANVDTSARWYAVGLSIGNKGYICGGYKQGSIDPGTDVWEYDPSADTWTQKAYVPVNYRIAQAFGFTIGGKGYLGTGYDPGGITGVYGKKFWEYDPSVDSWTQKADFGGGARMDAIGFSIGTKGYAGTGFETGNVFEDLWEYDPTIDNWTLSSTNIGGSAPRWKAIGVSIGNHGYVSFGNGTTDLWEWNPNSTGLNCLIPTALATTGITNTSAQLSWSTASADSFLIRYTIHGTNITSWIMINGQPAVTSYTLTGLFPGTQYDWLVRSICSSGSSTYPNVAATFTTQNSVVSCITPNSLGATAITNTAATVTWSAFIVADTFRVRYSLNGTTNFMWKDVNGAAGNNTGLTGLIPNSTYKFQVASRCNGVSSAYSIPYIFTTTNSISNCITPFGTSTSGITGTTADLNWSNLVTADTFRVRYSVNGTTNFIWKDVNGAGGVDSTQLTGLALNTTYQWQVRTLCNGVGTTPYSVSEIFSTLPARISSTINENNFIEITAFPNPAHNNLTLEFKTPIEKTVSIIVFDMSGRKWITKYIWINSNENSTDLNVSNLAKGIYIVEVQSEGLISKRIKILVE